MNLMIVRFYILTASESINDHEITDEFTLANFESFHKLRFIPPTISMLFMSYYAMRCNTMFDLLTI